MPIPAPPDVDHPLFPTLSMAQINAMRTSSWYETFIEITPKASFIDLDVIGEKTAFLDWLDADSIFIPLGAEPTAGPSTANAGASITEQDDDGDDDAEEDQGSDDESEAPVYRLPRLNEALRTALAERGGAVFPKLNWTAPKDAAFILPQTAHGPLHCASPADIYLLLKSSDFISHDLDPSRAYASGSAGTNENVAVTRAEAKLELVLKEYIQVNPSREFRCFVRDNVLLGISQRDSNFYDHLQSPETRQKICETVREFWEDEIRDQHPAMGVDYVFDVHLTPKLDDGIIIDINPYRPSTDALLFDYPELHDTFVQSQVPLSADAQQDRPRLPILRVIDSAAHPEASRSAPAYGGNMMPVEMIEMSQGRSLEEFREAWQDVLARGMTE